METVQVAIETGLLFSFLSLLVSFAATGIAYKALVNPERGALYEHRVQVLAELSDDLGKMLVNAIVAARFYDKIVESCNEAGLDPTDIISRDKTSIEPDDINDNVSIGDIKNYAKHRNEWKDAQNRIAVNRVKSDMVLPASLTKKVINSINQILLLGHYSLGEINGERQQLAESASKSLRDFISDARGLLAVDSLSEETVSLISTPSDAT